MKPLAEALECLAEHGLTPDLINGNCPGRIDEYGDCRKISVDLYIDDKCVNQNPWSARFVRDVYHAIDAANPGDIIGVDFDNTLALVDNYPHIDKANKPLIKAALYAQRKGLRVALVTCREDRAEHTKGPLAWDEN